MAEQFPLIPLEHSKNFKVGIPLNPCPQRRYRGADAEVAFPEGWHCQANNNGPAGAWGGYEQNCDDLAPDRLQVVSDEFGNVIRMVGGVPGRLGSAVLIHPFLHPVRWEDGETVVYRSTLQFSSELPARLYFNLELRGELNVQVRKNESVECLGLHIMDTTIMPAWWLDALDGDGLEKRCQKKFLIPPEHDQWHRITMALAPLPERDTWRALLRIRSQRQVVWEYQSAEGEHPNNVRAIASLMLGDERRRNEIGGVTYVRRAGAWETEDWLDWEADEEQG